MTKDQMPSKVNTGMIRCGQSGGQKADSQVLWPFEARPCIQACRGGRQERKTYCQLYIFQVASFMVPSKSDTHHSCIRTVVQKIPPMLVQQTVYSGARRAPSHVLWGGCDGQLVNLTQSSITWREKLIRDCLHQVDLVSMSVQTVSGNCCGKTQPAMGSPIPQARSWGRRGVEESN